MLSELYSLLSAQGIDFVTTKKFLFALFQWLRTDERILVSRYNISVKYKPKAFVVSASDLNPRYVECVPIFIETWLLVARSMERIDLEPRIILVGDKLPENLVPYEKYIIILCHANLIPRPFIAQNIRLLALARFDADVVMTTDIDMVPMSWEIYERYLLLSYSENRFLVLRDELQHEYPICYLMSPPKVADLLIGMPTLKLEKGIQELWEHFLATGLMYEGIHGGIGWNFDQKYVYSLVNTQSSENRAMFFRDSQTGFRRLDRLFAPSKTFLELFSSRSYTDYHMHLPIRKYHRLIKVILLRLQISHLKYRLLLILSIPLFCKLEFQYIINRINIKVSSSSEVGYSGWTN